MFTVLWWMLEHSQVKLQYRCKAPRKWSYQEYITSYLIGHKYHHIESELWFTDQNVQCSVLSGVVITNTSDCKVQFLAGHARESFVQAQLSNLNRLPASEGLCIFGNIVSIHVQIGPKDRQLLLLHRNVQPDTHKVARNKSYAEF